MTNEAYTALEKEANLLAVERDVALADWRRAVAERDALVDALTGTLGALRDYVREYGGNDTQHFEVLARADAALAQAMKDSRARQEAR